MSTSPTRKLRLGVAGLGRAFSLMLPTLQSDGRIELAAACDPRAAARDQFTRDFQVPVFENIEGLASESSLDAIYIASPHQFHAAHVRCAADQGKHVLVEKPMATTIEDCDDMVDACRSAGVHLIVGHSHSFDAPYLAARQFIESGAVGRVRMIHALNYTDFLYRPRRPEELMTSAGGGVVFSQAAHQVDVVRLLVGRRASWVRSMMGEWDATRPTEGAYAALIAFDDGTFASLTYSGYGRFDSDEWCGWINEIGGTKDPHAYGEARRKLARVALHGDEALLKAAATYGGPDWRPPLPNRAPLAHQHFGPVIVSCERGDLRPMPDALLVYGDGRRERVEIPAPAIPRFEVMDELIGAVLHGHKPVHDGPWARATLEVCLAMLISARRGEDVKLTRQVALRE